ncbi:lipoyl-protein ligase [Burkholderiales bacterium 8X]|nr:lipoyl-protein ligase [Burkholderiales bacterium 8X]
MNADEVRPGGAPFLPVPAPASPDRLRVRSRGSCDYAGTLAEMQAFCEERDRSTADELWLLEHPSVYTLGISGGAQHLHDPCGIPVVASDRGGQVTWHGPGQLVAYALLDLRRSGLGMGALIQLLEQAVVRTAARWGIEAAARRDAPGVYVGDRKLASIGMRLRRGCTYHGIALNVSNDLAPFAQIDPCGHPGLQMTRLADLGGPADLDLVSDELVRNIRSALTLSPRQLSSFAPRSSTTLRTQVQHH